MADVAERISWGHTVGAPMIPATNAVAAAAPIVVVDAPSDLEEVTPQGQAFAPWMSLLLVIGLSSTLWAAIAVGIGLFLR